MSPELRKILGVSRFVDARAFDSKDAYLAAQQARKDRWSLKNVYAGVCEGPYIRAARTIRIDRYEHLIVNENVKKRDFFPGMRSSRRRGTSSSSPWALTARWEG